MADRVPPSRTREGLRRQHAVEMEKRRSDPEYNRRRLDQAKAWRERVKEERNARLREKYKNDPEYRARMKLYATRTYERQKSKNFIRALRLRRYGLTLTQYDEMLAKQAGLCAICLTPPKQNEHLAVDHCHASGAVRGLLCRACNTGLGFYKDDVELMKAAIAYLEARRGN